MQATDRTSPGLFHTLQAVDAGALIDFCTEAFGFVLTARYEDDGRVAHAELRWPEAPGGVMLGTYAPGREYSQTPGTAGAYLVTEDADALCARALARGAEIVVPLRDTDYGSREFTVRDPEGNLWSFGTYPGAPLEE
ncbi:VOC family protein [Brevibacterium salitolerans]|uniref:VOC family protein n=1 Tax=Brevibacterium salitolerans TaxID=1403566 RepID=A0ABN2WVV9_9MICO